MLAFVEENVDVIWDVDGSLDTDLGVAATKRLVPFVVGGDGDDKDKDNDDGCNLGIFVALLLLLLMLLLLLVPVLRVGRTNSSLSCSHCSCFS